MNPADWPPWFGIAPISSAVFGVPVGLVVMAVVSLATAAPDGETVRLVDFVRYPNLAPSDPGDQTTSRHREAGSG